MIIIIDTNILISAALEKESKLYDLISNEFIKIDFITPEYALEEINFHKKRICKRANKEL